MINHLKSDGILVLSWGSAKNLKHCLVEAPDGKFHCLKVEKVTNFLKSRNLFIHTSIYDGDLKNIIKDFNNTSTLDGYGEHNLIAFNTDFTDKFEKGFVSTIFEEDKE
jgi:hypothetical protein